MTENPLSQLETSINPDYNKSGKKIIDFLIGFFIVILLCIIAGMLIFFPLNFGEMSFESRLFNQILLGILIVLPIIIIALVIAFFSKGKIFIAYGIISGLLLPILIFGACISIF